MSSAVLIAGGYGAVGQVVSAELALADCAQIVIAGRDRARAEAVAARLGGAGARHIPRSHRSGELPRCARGGRFGRGLCRAARHALRRGVPAPWPRPCRDFGLARLPAAGRGARSACEQEWLSVHPQRGACSRGHQLARAARDRLPRPRAEMGSRRRRGSSRPSWSNPCVTAPRRGACSTSSSASTQAPPWPASQTAVSSSPPSRERPCGGTRRVRSARSCGARRDGSERRIDAGADEGVERGHRRDRLAQACGVPFCTGPRPPSLLAASSRSAARRPRSAALREHRRLVLVPSSGTSSPSRRHALAAGVDRCAVGAIGRTLAAIAR